MSLGEPVEFGKYKPLHPPDIEAFRQPQIFADHDVDLKPCYPIRASVSSSARFSVANSLIVLRGAEVLDGQARLRIYL
jgi:hypothetical protein